MLGPGSSLQVHCPRLQHETTRPNIDLLPQLEADSTLLTPNALAARLEALDQLDRALTLASLHEDDLRRALALQQRFEAVNDALYASLRASIAAGDPAPLRDHLRALTPPADPTAPGLRLDARDDLLSGILFPDLSVAPSAALSAEMVAFQPTPARHILDLIDRLPLTAGDLFVDLGSGLGRVSLLVSLFTGAKAAGIEIDPGLVASSRTAAEALALDAVRFDCADVRDACLDEGTVFFLYTPFSGALLEAVLARLESLSHARPITLATLGPVTATVARLTWVRADGPSDPGKISLFRSR